MKDDRPASVEEQLKLPAQEETDLVHLSGVGTPTVLTGHLDNL
jgi:hypothetical protein